MATFNGEVAVPSTAVAAAPSIGVFHGEAPRVTYADGQADAPPPDAVAPIITVVSPTPGAAPGMPGGFPRSRQLAEQTPVVLRIYDVTPGLGYVSLSVVVPTLVDGVLRDVEEVVFRRGQFRGRHIRGSTQRIVIETIGGIPTEVLELSVRREGGWPRVTNLRFFADAIDASGNIEGS